MTSSDEELESIQEVSDQDDSPEEYGRRAKGKQRDERADNDDEGGFDDQDVAVGLTKKDLKQMIAEVVEATVRRVAPRSPEKHRPVHVTPRTKRRTVHTTEKLMDADWERKEFLVCCV